MKKYFEQQYSGHKAVIEAVKIAPYRGAKKQTAYRLMIIDTTENNFLLHVSCYESFGDAKTHLDGFGLAWKEVA